MTSTEFARRYRLLKNVANRGARSFLAQQVDLGRMVMVHYLDSESPQQRVATLARLDALGRPARDKLVEIADVDGSPVAVTLFITSFADFTSWLDSVSSASSTPVASAPLPQSVPAAPQPSGDFTQMFGKIEAPPPSAPAVVAQPRAEAAPRAGGGEFTMLFGKIDEPFSSGESLRIVDNARTAPPPLADTRAPAAPNDSASGFTAIFGAFAGAPEKRDLPQALPPLAELRERQRVMPPVAPQPEVEPTPAPALPEAPAAGEFTQLFQRLSPSAQVPLTTNGTAPAAPFDSPRSFDSVPRSDPAPPPAAPPAAPPVMSGFGAPPAGLRPPAFGAVPSAPASGNIMSRVGAEPGPSEFTRILSPIALPSGPTPASAPAAAPKPAASAEPTAAAAQKKSMVPLIVALNVVVLLTITIVAYFVLRR